MLNALVVKLCSESEDSPQNQSILQTIQNDEYVKTQQKIDDYIENKAIQWNEIKSIQNKIQKGKKSQLTTKLTILKPSSTQIQYPSSYSSFVDKAMNNTMNNQIKRKFENQFPPDQLNKLQK